MPAVVSLEAGGGFISPPAQLLISAFDVFQTFSGKGFGFLDTTRPGYDRSRIAMNYLEAFLAAGLADFAVAALGAAAFLGAGAADFLSSDFSLADSLEILREAVFL